MSLTFASYPHVRGVQKGESLSDSPLPRVFRLKFIVRCPRAVLLAALLSIVLPGIATAQVQQRITARIDETSLTTLRGNTHPLARAQFDQGAVGDSQPMRRMLLLLRRSPGQDAALKQLVDQQQSKTSPSYHKWLTPQQFGQQYGPADADIQTVTDWLTLHGFQVARVSAAKTLIEFSGTAGQVRNAFHTEIHRYNVNGNPRFANNSDPKIPSALAPVVAGPVSLNNFPHRALSKNLGTFRKTKSTGQVAPLYSFGGCTTITGAGSNCNAVGPGDFANIYNVFKLWQTGISGHPIDGTGQTIAIVGDSEICTNTSPDFGASYIGPNGNSVTCSSDDVAQFRSLFGLPANSPNVILDGPDPGFNGDEIEGDLDVEWAGAVAKAATIDFVVAEDTEATFGTDLAAEYIVDNNLAPILSESFGECEASLGSDLNFFEASLWEQAAAEGITVVVSAGDSGSTACDDPNSQNFAYQFGPAVNGIASTPFNVAAGGTDFDITASGYEQNYWSSGANATVNGINNVSAISYIPETTWNDSCAQSLTVPGTITGCTPTNGGIVAGGGGESNCAYQDNNSSCYYYAKPSWQTLASGSGLTAANDLTRDLPDISLFAADGYKSNSFYVICESDLNLGGAACNLNTPYFDFVGVGGTSSAAPTFAGMMALVNQNMMVNHSALSDPVLGARQGNANYGLYSLAASQTTSQLNCNSSSTSLNPSCTFNDVTKGNNSVPCEGGQGDYGCSSASAGYGVEEAINLNNGVATGNLAWNAASGLDLATGLGSVNAFNLVNNWPTTVGAFTPTTTTLCLSTTNTNSTSCPGPISIQHGTTVYVNAQVNASGSPIQVSETFPTAAASDPNSPVQAEDVSLVGSFSGGTTRPPDQFTSNNYFLSNYDIYPLTNGTTSGQGVCVINGVQVASTFCTQYLVGGTYNVVAHYAGDGTFGGSDSSPVSVTVTPEGSTAAVTVEPFDPSGNLTSTPIPYGDFTVVRVDVTGASSGEENAAGFVTLTDNGVAAVNSTGGTTPTFPLNTEGYMEDQTPYLAVGSHNFVAKYNGDNSYNASSNSVAIPALVVTKAPTATTVTASTMTASLAQSVTLTATVGTTSYGLAPTGSVQFFVGGVAFGSPVAVVGSINPSTEFAQAVATMPTTTLAAGSNAITAEYLSDNNYAASAISTPSVTVTVGSVGINLSPGAGCSTATISILAPGQQSGACSITVMEANGFAGAVTLNYAVTATPANAVDTPTCSFGAPDSNFTAPNTINLNTTTATSGNAAMTCSSTAASGVLFRPTYRLMGQGWPLAAGAAVSVICLFCLLAIPMQRRWRWVPLAALLVVVAGVGVSCSGGGGLGGAGSGVTNPGTTVGAYTVTVTAKTSASNPTIPITLNVR